MLLISTWEETWLKNWKPKVLVDGKSLDEDRVKFMIPIWQQFGWKLVPTYIMNSSITLVKKNWRVEHCLVRNTCPKSEIIIFLTHICTVFAKSCFKIPKIIRVSIVFNLLPIKLWKDLSVWHASDAWCERGKVPISKTEAYASFQLRKRFWISVLTDTTIKEWKYSYQKKNTKLPIKKK